jgi:hypothetical protein
MYTPIDSAEPVTMCQKPLSINGFEVACRQCDQCIATYKNTWVSRCMAEKASMPYCYVLTLTYASVDGESPLGARVFRYRDVQNMWKRIRAAGKKRWDHNIGLRYVIVGEKGTRYGRCHYHGVVFSDRPITELGEFDGAKTKEFALKRRLNWSMWGHGFVQFDSADRNGMAYVLKYILKDKMTSKKSQGHGRQGKTEWLASSQMWCSKVPAIGETWLFRKLDEMIAVGTCPPDLRMRVPGGGDWYVNGQLQQKMCVHLHHANAEYREKRGRDLAGWSTLLASLDKEIENFETGELGEPKAKGWLLNGEEIEQEAHITEEQSRQNWEQYKAEYQRKKRIAAPITSARQIVRECGNVLPCPKCIGSFDDRQRANLQQEYELWFDEWAERNPRPSQVSPERYRDSFERWWRSRLRPSRGCQFRDTPEHRDAFDRLRPLERANPETRYRKGIHAGL